MSVRHPIYDTIFDAVWLSRGVDPKWVRDLAEGRAVISRAFAQGMLEEFGIPISSWPRLEPAYPPADRRNLPSRNDSGRVETMPEQQIVSKPKRRGPPLKSKGPAAQVSRELGVSVRRLAATIGKNYQSLRTWDLRGTLPPEVRVLCDRALAAHRKRS